MRITRINNYNNVLYNKFSPEFADYMYNGVHNNFKHEQINTLSNCYYLPLHFGKEKPNREYSSDIPELYEHPSDFQICKFDEIPCPSCGKIMLTRNGYENFLKELENQDPDNYLEFLNSYKKYMRPIEESVYNDISKLSEETGIKDIRKLLVILRNSKLPQLQSIQMKKIKKMKSLATTLPEEEKRNLISKLGQLRAQIKKKKSQEAAFRRKIMIEEIANFKIKNKYTHAKLQNIAKSFPTSSDMSSAWIVKYSGLNKKSQPYTSKDIAERMLFSSVPNVDHIIPYSEEKNHDNIANYLAMHSGCNGQKSNKSLMQWYNEDKELRQASLIAYFQKVNELIESSSIEDDKYKLYVAKATETISKLSKGKIDIEI